MFDHVTIRVSDRAECERFYGTVLRALGVEQSHPGARFAEWDDCSLAAADAEHADSADRNGICDAGPASIVVLGGEPAGL